MPAATSTKLREQIVQWFHDFNLPINEIVLLSGRSRTTVYKILHLYDMFGQVTNLHAMSSSRKWILTPQDLQYIQSILAAKPTMFLDKIQEKLFQNREIFVSLATIGWTLHHLALSSKSDLVFMWLFSREGHVKHATEALDFITLEKPEISCASEFIVSLHKMWERMWQRCGSWLVLSL